MKGFLRLFTFKKRQVDKYKWFSQNDFYGCYPECKIEDMDSEFMRRLDKARDISGVPYIVLSAYRTFEHERSRGRDGFSSHVKGIAMDIRAGTSRQRGLILKGLYKMGFNRIGIYLSFIHVDADLEKDRDVVWLNG